MWNEIDENSHYYKDKGAYQNHLIEQYKIYVEMADRVSSRRNLANVFFLTMNTTMLGLVGFAFEKIELISPSWLIMFPIFGLLLMNLIWGRLVRSYKDLNSAKYKVLRELSSKLPASPWSEEWVQLGEGKDKKKYLPLTKLEMFVPILFGITYLLIGIYAVFIQ